MRPPQNPTAPAASWQSVPASPVQTQARAFQLSNYAQFMTQAFGAQVSHLRYRYTPQVNCGYDGGAVEFRFTQRHRAFQP